MGTAAPPPDERQLCKRILWEADSDLPAHGVRWG
jgi:hypothetical protein